MNDFFYAFVEFDREEDAERALQQMDGKEIAGKRIVVRFAKPRSNGQRKYDDNEDDRARNYDSYRDGPPERGDYYNDRRQNSPRNYPYDRNSRDDRMDRDRQPRMERIPERRYDDRQYDQPQYDRYVSENTDDSRYRTKYDSYNSRYNMNGLPPERDSRDQFVRNEPREGDRREVVDRYSREDYKFGAQEDRYSRANTYESNSSNNRYGREDRYDNIPVRQDRYERQPIRQDRYDNATPVDRFSDRSYDKYEPRGYDNDRTGGYRSFPRDDMRMPRSNINNNYR